MAVVVGMANDNRRDMHAFFMPKASEFPSRQFHLTPESMSEAESGQKPDTLRKQALM